MLTQEVEQRIREIIFEIVPEAFIVEIALHRSKRSILSVLVDTDDGIQLPQCAKISRSISHYLEEHPEFDFKFNLEVSSPGVGSPLVMVRQYKKNIGRELKVLTHEGKEYKGKLLEVSEEKFRLAPPKPKKKKKGAPETPEFIDLNYDEIKTAKVLVSFR